MDKLIEQLNRIEYKLDKLLNINNINDNIDNITYAINNLYKLMNKHNLIDNGWSYGFNYRKTSLGITLYKTKTIELSYIFINKVNKDEIINTILHEIAHALVGHKAGHGPIWKEKALSIGCNAQRCYNNDNIEIDYKYIFICSNGCKIGRHRLSKKLNENIICKKHKLPLKLV